MLNERKQVLYGLHFEPGVAEYRDPGKEPYRVLISEPAAKQMDSTFPGCPVFVDHVDNVKDREPDGYVAESFYNEIDGKHWVKFVVVTEKGEQAIRNGWKLSNAYVPTKFSQGGLWHGVEYAKEIIEGEYEHLALVQKPRYENSIILTPEQFKEYNSAKSAELEILKNSQGEETVFEIFKKSKVENAADYDSLMVTLPKSKVQVSFTTLVNEMDKIQNMHGYANGDHMVKVGDEEMSVNDLVGKHMEMADCMKAMNDEKASLDKEQKESKDLEKEDEGKDMKKNMDEEMKKKGNDEEEIASKDEKKKNEADALKKIEEQRKVDQLHFDRLKNAVDLANSEPGKINLGMDGAARGRSRYGSPSVAK